MPNPSVGRIKRLCHRNSKIITFTLIELALSEDAFLGQTGCIHIRLQNTYKHIPVGISRTPCKLPAIFIFKATLGTSLDQHLESHFHCPRPTRIGTLSHKLHRSWRCCLQKMSCRVRPRKHYRSEIRGPIVLAPEIAQTPHRRNTGTFAEFLPHGPSELVNSRVITLSHRHVQTAGESDQDLLSWLGFHISDARHNIKVEDLRGPWDFKVKVIYGEYRVWCDINLSNELDTSLQEDPGLIWASIEFTGCSGQRPQSVACPASTVTGNIKVVDVARPYIRLDTTSVVLKNYNKLV